VNSKFRLMSQVGFYEHGNEFKVSINAGCFYGPYAIVCLSRSTLQQGIGYDNSKN
jgi:hypothetical protein